ncbi:MAG: hypothetical protein KDC52_13880 [Ignavibacteriae bacterium]|nr:hypothetical protein [Ignavibacteriota bacterium]
MDSLIGTLSAVVLFLAIIGFILYLIKINVFSSKIAGGGSSNKQLKKLNSLKMENEDLNKEIKFLEDKNRRLKQKIEQLKSVIKTLEEQKNQLENSELKLKDLRYKKDEALAMLAHDIKNPASTIKNFVELLESYDLNAQDQNEILGGLVEVSTRIVRLADEFSNIVAEEFEPFQMKKTKTDFYKTVESIVKANKVKADKKNIKVRLYQPKDDLYINMDEEKIKEVIDNYVSNAVKYCPENSKVEVVTNKDKNFVTLEVTDNGYGLTEDEVAHAFDKGTKLSNKPTGDETSSGLGLWIAKKIVEEHHGKVWLTSKKSFGSTFAFKIPID